MLFHSLSNDVEEAIKSWLMGCSDETFMDILDKETYRIMVQRSVVLVIYMDVHLQEIHSCTPVTKIPTINQERGQG